MAGCGNENERIWNISGDDFGNTLDWIKMLAASSSDSIGDGEDW